MADEIQHRDFSRSHGNAVPPQILLTDTTGFTGAAQLAISLARAGCVVSAVCPIPHSPLTKVRAIRETFHYSSLAPLKSLAMAITKARPRIIIPCDDRAVQHLHELHAEASWLGAPAPSLASLIEGSLGSPLSYPIVSSRYDLLKCAREEGLRVPETSLIRTLDDLKTCHFDGIRPLVLKADGTWGGNGVRIVQTRQQAADLFLELTRAPGILQVGKRMLLSRDPFSLHRWLSGAKPEIIAQEYIPGRPANCGVFCWKGRVVAGISVEVVSTRKQNGPASVVRVIDHPGMRFAAERIAWRLQISGFFGLDFMLEDATATAYLIEMNPRCTRLSHLQLGKERDMVWALCMQLSGQARQPRPPLTHNDLIAYFPEAWISRSEFLPRSFHDLPQGEPALMRELLGDSSDRTILGRMLDRWRRHSAERESREIRESFLDAVAPGIQNFSKLEGNGV